MALAGCGIGTVTTATGGSLAITGNVHGGVQPVAGATIQLFAAGTGGNGSLASSLLTNPVVTDSHGGFSLTGDYHCSSRNQQVYLVARGGNPGFSGNVNNHALVLLSALGNCDNLAANPSAFLQLNEVSTVAAVYALAQFTTAFDHVGASASNTTGLANAFLDAHLLADPATGMVPTLPANLSIESDKLYALADAIVPCVNSDGGTACTALFSAATPASGSAPTDVLGALLNIVRAPSRNVSAVFSAISSTPPYPTKLTHAPSDWTMSLTVTGGGISEPTAIGLDSQGNVWANNFGGDAAHPAGLIGFSPQGTPFAGSPFSPGLQTDSYGLAIDRNDNIWVTSYDNVQGPGIGSVAKFMGVGSSTPGMLIHQYQDSSLDWPESIVFDPAENGTVLTANYYGGTVTFFNLDGSVSKVLGANFARNQRPAFPVSVASDNAGGAWTGDQGDNYVVHLLADGTQVKSACCIAAQSVALDLEGDVWATNYYPIGNPPVYTYSEIAPSGQVLIDEQSGGGIYAPGGATIDAGGQFWVLNYNSSLADSYDTITELAGNNTSVPAGTPISPSTGFGRDAMMVHAYSIIADASGNLWATVRDGDSLRMFFGMATPTAMPAGPTPRLP